jgi:hypothetical protein
MNDSLFEMRAPKPPEQFNNGLMRCLVLARKGDTALIYITNHTPTPFVVPMCHKAGASEWDNGKYFATLSDAWAEYSERIADNP